MLILSIWPTTVEGWAGLIILLVSLVGAIAKLIPTLIKLGRATKIIAKNKDRDKLITIARKAMAEAQASGQSGAQKQEMVVAAVKAGAKELEIEINDEDINDLINSIKELKQFFNEMKEADKIANK